MEEAERKALAARKSQEDGNIAEELPKKMVDRQRENRGRALGSMKTEVATM
jgi:hypothetical protein